MTSNIFGAIRVLYFWHKFRLHLPRGQVTSTDSETFRVAVIRSEMLLLTLV
jgi:hypothetical protein